MPLKAPIDMPAAIMISGPTAASPVARMYMAPSTALSAALNGNDRSMPPPIITIDIPMASTANVEA